MQEQAEADPNPTNRRRFISLASSGAMACGLAAGYGTLAVMAGRYLYPDKPRQLAWLYVADAANLKVGGAVRFETPAGQIITIARRSNQDDESAFLALSSTCPHLGCQVHWEAQNSRFFCPCHNGAFDAEGNAIAGPPLDARQSLPKYSLKIEGGLIFVQAPVDALG